MFKNILVPTDGSQFSQDAAQAAVNFAKETGARITAFYTIKTLPQPYYAEGLNIGLVPPDYAKSAEAQAERFLGYIEKLCHENNVPCTKLTLTRNAAHEGIIDAAKQSLCDLIFMASHGKKGISALLLGSETQKVLTHSKIPILVYR
jgi:nucleotide-binding universal stress UspA family protein